MLCVDNDTTEQYLFLINAKWWNISGVGGWERKDKQGNHEHISIEVKVRPQKEVGCLWLIIDW